MLFYEYKLNYVYVCTAEPCGSLNILKVTNSLGKSVYYVTNTQFAILILFIKYSGYHIEEDEMGDASDTHGKDKYIQNFGG
jgi:hypothetical protein